MSDLVLFENPYFIADLMYAGSDNMLSCPVYEEVGFGNRLYMHKNVAEKLMSLVPVLEKMGRKMRVCDAYRPPVAHQKLLEIIPMPGFFAKTPERSNHCHGTAVDVCLTDMEGNNLVYPTEVDAYDPDFAAQVQEGKFDGFFLHLKKARHDYMGATSEAIENREQLKNLMESHGFESIPYEWWHYDLVGWQNYPLIEWE